MTPSDRTEAATALARDLSRKLSASLGLLDEPQDWGIVNADGARLEEFADFLATRELAPTQQYDMIELLLASANERLTEDPSAELQIVLDTLRAHPSAVVDHYEYWAALDDPDEFPLGAWLRRNGRPG